MIHLKHETSAFLESLLLPSIGFFSPLFYCPQHFWTASVHAELQQFFPQILQNRATVLYGFFTTCSHLLFVFLIGLKRQLLLFFRMWNNSFSVFRISFSRASWLFQANFLGRTVVHRNLFPHLLNSLKFVLSESRVPVRFHYQPFQDRERACLQGSPHYQFSTKIFLVSKNQIQNSSLLSLLLLPFGPGWQHRGLWGCGLFFLKVEE